MANQPTAVVVTSTGAGYGQTIRAHGHTLSADEPVAVGGTDTGPNPYELLLAALGSCTSMTVQMYARRKGWPLAAVSVRLRHRKVHAQDCADCEATTAYVDLIEKEVEVSGDLSAQQRERLLEIADHCPVHRTLTGQVRIRSNATNATR
jgi:putative redox protein